MEQEKDKKKLLTTRGIVLIGMLGGMATVLMFFEVPLWFAPPFYKLDLSEIPIMVGAFAFGPLAGAVIELIKILLIFVMRGSQTMGIGEGANFLIGCSLVVPASVIYRRWHTRKGAFIGLGVGVVSMMVVGALMNGYILLPTYAKAFHMEIDALVAFGTQVNPKITSLPTFIALAVIPFNFVKGLVVSLITGALYKRIRPLLNGRG